MTVLSALQPNRVVRYEIDAEREGRWTTESISGEEAEAIEIARRLLDTKTCDAVRVLREHQSWGRVVSTTEVYSDRRPMANADTRLSTCDDEGAWCETLDDLYSDRSRRTMGQMLRTFLDANGVTPTEVLYSYRVFKRLDAADGLLTAASGRIARARATAVGADPMVMLRTLEKLVNKAAMRTREITAVRRLPLLGDGGLDALWKSVRQGVTDPSEQRFQFRHSLCRTIESCSGLTHRLDTVLGWGAKAKEPESVAVLDEMVSDCVGSAAIIKDVLGIQSDLGSALAMLVDLVRNRIKEPPAKAPGWLATVRNLMMEQPFPATRHVLLARVRRELSGDRRLGREGEAGEAKALGLLCDKLYSETDGVYLGGAEMVAALARRWSRLDRPGGFGDLKIPAGPASQVIRGLIDYERTAFGEARKRATATVILSTVRDVPPSARGDLAGLDALVAGSGMPEPARKAIVAELAARH